MAAIRHGDAGRLARPEMARLVPYVGGKSLDEMEREYGRRDFVKLASNENPVGPSPRAMAVMRTAIREAHLYPESGYPRLKEAIASRTGLDWRNVVLGNGSNEVLVLAASAFLRPGDEAVMADPTFVVYEHAVIAAGARAIKVPLKNYRHDLGRMSRAVTRRTRIVFVCNPNNPTGTIVRAGEVERFLRSLPRGLIVVFDEAYAGFVRDGRFPDSLKYVRAGLPVLAVRTFAKLHGLAGLRVGYGLGPVDLVGVIERLRQPFNVNAVAYRAAEAALGDERHVARTVSTVRRGMRLLSRGFRGLGLKVVPSSANFILVGVGRDGAEFAGDLLRRGVIVRPLPGTALKNHVRVTVGTTGENGKALRAFRSVLRQRPGPARPAFRRLRQRPAFHRLRRRP
jgi:histidinol-phosphate aminotransferase